MAQLRHQTLDDIRALGAELHTVGNGSTAQLAWFLKTIAPPFPVWTDPSLASYRAAGFERGLSAIASPRAIAGYAGSVLAGFPNQGGVKGDALQIGGALIVLPGHRLAYRYAARFNGDHPEPSALLEALRSALRGD